MTRRINAIEAIRTNIDGHGYHLYIVGAGTVPRYAYTIGLSESNVDAEVIFPGGVTFMALDVELIVSEAARHLRDGASHPSTGFVAEPFGHFSFQEVDARWVASLALGALDYYEGRSVRMLQIVPEDRYHTIDIPDMRRALHDDEPSAWQWLWTPWEYSVPEDATATTNLEALKGAIVTEAARWEVGEWELFAGPGPEVSTSDMRVVPIGTLLAHDLTLTPVMDLEVGRALRRDETGRAWRVWG